MLRNFPAVRPSLLLDFTNAQMLDPRVNFSRRSRASYFDSAGILRLAEASVARIDFDPVSRACRGLLIEEQRTNLCLRSEAFDNAAWTKTRCTVTANAALAPNGTTTADLTTGDGSTGGSMGVFQEGIATSSATAYTISVFAKAGTSTWLAIDGWDGFTAPQQFFNLTNGTVGATPSGMSNPRIEAVGDGWYRCSVTRTTGSASTFLRPGFVHATADGAVAVLATLTLTLWGAQLEAGAFATSYVATVGSAVTRAADTARVDQLAPWLNVNGGTLLVEASIPSLAIAGRGPVRIDNGGEDNRIMLRTQGGNDLSAIVIAGNAGSANMQTSLAANVTFKAALAYGLNDFALCKDGGAVVTDNLGNVPSGLSRMLIGDAGTSATVSGSLIRRLVYYPARLSNAALQAMTA